jgi:Zn-dependent protease
MLISALALRLGWAYHVLHIDGASGHADFATSVLGVFFFLNLLLGTFNLLPVPPLDGSTGILLFMGERLAQRYLDWLRGSSYAIIGLLVAVLGFRYVYGPIEATVTRALLPEQLIWPLYQAIFRH